MLQQGTHHVQVADGGGEVECSQAAGVAGVEDCLSLQRPTNLRPRPRGLLSCGGDSGRERGGDRNTAHYAAVHSILRCVLAAPPTTQTSR